MQRWMCEACGYIYDPAAPEDGADDDELPAGAAFEDVPDGWRCPVCAAVKADFIPYED
jgi:rubredoxin